MSDSIDWLFHSSYDMANLNLSICKLSAFYLAMEPKSKLKILKYNIDTI